MVNVGLVQGKDSGSPQQSSEYKVEQCGRKFFLKITSRSLNVCTMTMFHPLPERWLNHEDLTLFFATLIEEPTNKSAYRSLSVNKQDVVRDGRNGR